MTRPTARDVVEGAIHRRLRTSDHAATAAAAREILQALSKLMGRPHVHPFATDPADVLRAEGWDAATRYLWEAGDD